MTFKNWLRRAQKERFAIGHFNVSNMEVLMAVMRSAVKLRAPVIIGVSEGERDFIGIRQIVALVRSYRDEYQWPIFLNADHTKSIERVKEAVDAGFDSVHFDGSELPYDENVRLTRQAVEYANSKDPEISVEGELGYLRGTSKIQGTVEIKSEDMTDPDRAAEFVKSTGVDRLAPVFGNIHGIVTKQKEELDLDRIAAIRSKTDAFLVLHGGSGLSDDDIRGAILRGIVKFHINTELRVMYRKTLERVFRDMPDETTTYKFLAPVVQAVEALVGEKIKLFGSAGKV